jgi:hypothetical protein
MRDETAVRVGRRGAPAGIARRRPPRFPGTLVGNRIFDASRESPFVEDGRKNLAEREAQLRLPDAG